MLVLNDGEAHTRAAAKGRRYGAGHPVLSFSNGTSVEFGRTSSTGTIESPTANRNWDIGSMSLRTRCSNPEIWWACGSNRLAELESSRPRGQEVRHFGARLGALITDFSILFQLTTVVLTGGISLQAREPVARPRCRRGPEHAP